MIDFGHFGKLFIIIGLLFLLIGLSLTLGPKIPFLGKLPGDLRIQKGPVTIYFPVVTSILLSIILTIILNILKK